MRIRLKPVETFLAGSLSPLIAMKYVNEQSTEKNVKLQLGMSLPLVPPCNDCCNSFTHQTTGRFFSCFNIRWYAAPNKVLCFRRPSLNQRPSLTRRKCGHEIEKKKSYGASQVARAQNKTCFFLVTNVCLFTYHPLRFVLGIFFYIEDDVIATD